MTRTTPAEAWKQLKEGNARFVGGEAIHPHQGSEDRSRLIAGQQPIVVLFGCSDSRFASEIIFDQGLGDMFIVRNAGHVADAASIGSVEFATEVLGVPLILICGHQSCGAVTATVKAVNDGEVPGGYIRTIVEAITPSVFTGKSQGCSEVNEFVAHHSTETAHVLMERSAMINKAVASGEVAIVSMSYHLDDGEVELHNVIGDIGES